MLVADLLNSCANESVAEAAVSSIGGDFARKMRSDADDQGLSVGFLTASVVRRFATDASERDWRDLFVAVRGQDFPVLSGLQVILTRFPRQFADDRPLGRRRHPAIPTTELVDCVGLGAQ